MAGPLRPASCADSRFRIYSPMRLLFHLPTSFVGGAERHLEYLIRYLRRDHIDDETAILVTYEHPQMRPFVETFAVKHALVRDARHLAWVIEQHAPDVIQFYTSARLYEALGLVRHRARVIETVHNLARFEGDGFSYPKDRTDFFVCVSAHARLFAWTQAPTAPAIVILNGVDYQRFTPNPTRRSITPVVGFAGRLSPEKGIDTLLELAASLPFPVEVVGRDFGQYAGRAPHNVRLLPETATPEAYYQRWWAFVSTSPKEAFGMAIAEAMACGCPPVLLDCGGITPYLRHGRDALIAADVGALAMHLKDVVGGRTLLNPLGPRFSAETMANQYWNAYTQDISSIVPPRQRATRPKPDSKVEVFRPVQQRPRVDGGALAITPHGWYGVVRALAGVCDHYADPEWAIDAIDHHRPRLVVLGCFQNDWLPICRHAHQRGARVVATWHASYILNEFHAINRVWMAQMLDAFRDGVIDYLASPHRGLAENWTHFGYPTAWLPNIIDETLIKQPKLSGVHVGLFGSGQNWKNMECQMAAAAMIPGITVHSHVIKTPEVIQRLGISVTQHAETLADAEYHRLLGSMTVNRCVSQSEVYSYLTAESFLMETPVLTGSITPLVQDGAVENTDLQLCHTAHFDDPIAIRDKLIVLVELHAMLGPRLRAHMLRVNERYRAQCAKAVSSWAVK